jgi:hypothetical protein
MGDHLDDLNHPKRRKYLFQNASNDLLSAASHVRCLSVFFGGGGPGQRGKGMLKI